MSALVFIRHINVLFELKSVRTSEAVAQINGHTLRNNNSEIFSISLQYSPLEFRAESQNGDIIENTHGSLP